MEKNILRVFGNLAAIQRQYNLKSYGKIEESFIMRLLSYGQYVHEVEASDKKNVVQLDVLERDCKAVGLETLKEDSEMRDGSWSHSGSNYVRSVKLTISLPVSPAIEVLYAKSNKK